MSFWDRIFGEDENANCIIVSVVISDGIKIFPDIGEACQYIKENNLSFAQNELSEVQNDPPNERRILAMKIVYKDRIFEYSSIENLIKDKKKFASKSGRQMQTDSNFLFPQYKI